MKPSEPRKVTGADGPTGPPAGRQGGTQPASDPSEGAHSARVEAALDADLAHDDGRMECHNHDGSCCPAGDSHDQTGYGARRHRVLTMLAAADAVGADDTAGSPDGRAALARVEALAVGWEADHEKHRLLRPIEQDHRPCESGARAAAGRMIRAAITDTDTDRADDTAGLVAGLMAEIQRLKRWKAEAKPAMDGLQELGDALGISLGQRITGVEAKVAVEQLRAELAHEHSRNMDLGSDLLDARCQRDAAMGERDEALAEVESLRDRQRGLPVFHCQTHLCGSCGGCKRAGILDDNTRLRAKYTAFVARVLELAGRADRTPVSNDPFRVGMDIADDLRALVTTDDRATIERGKGEAAAVAYPGPDALARLIDREVARSRAATYRATAPTEAVTGDYWHGPDRTEPTEGESE